MSTGVASIASGTSAPIGQVGATNPSGPQSVSPNMPSAGGQSAGASQSDTVSLTGRGSDAMSMDRSGAGSYAALAQPAGLGDQFMNTIIALIAMQAMEQDDDEQDKGASLLLAMSAMSGQGQMSSQFSSAPTESGSAVEMSQPGSGYSSYQSQQPSTGGTINVAG